jgi:predicted phosphoribosyltransferase
MTARFRDRHAAGRYLATALDEYAGRPDVLVLALPRGGVPVGYEVARALGAPFDLMLVRKLGVPGQEELAMGAIASGGIRVISDDVVGALGIPERAIAAAAANEQQELERRERAYGIERPAPDIAGKTVILVDDGLATGATMRAAVTALRAQKPRKLVVAVPIAAAETCEALRQDVDAVVCALAPSAFLAVGQGYEDFSQVSDQEVRDLLYQARQLAGDTRPQQDLREAGGP